jgi:hypothetical protein
LSLPTGCGCRLCRRGAICCGPATLEQPLQHCGDSETSRPGGTAKKEIRPSQKLHHTPTPVCFCYVLRMQDLQGSVVYVLQIKDLAEKSCRGRSVQAGGCSSPAAVGNASLFALLSPHSFIFSLRTLRLCVENAFPLMHFPASKNCIIMQFLQKTPFSYAL